MHWVLTHIQQLAKVWPQGMKAAVYSYATWDCRRSTPLLDKLLRRAMIRAMMWRHASAIFAIRGFSGRLQGPAVLLLHDGVRCRLWNVIITRMHMTARHAYCIHIRLQR